jgi:uncharacterized membrane protein YkoI
MKHLLLTIIVATFTSMNASAQTDKEVPAYVKNTFSQKFPKATKVKWDNEEENEWEAEFKMDGKEYTASFDNNGKWLETESDIESKEIPSTVKATLDKEFLGYKIKESDISETDNGKVYEFDLKKGDVEIEVAIDINGKVINKEQDKEGDIDVEDND